MVTSAQVLAVIPARAHSTRFPFKILAPILGKPMIQYVWEAAKASQCVGRVVVATDHPDIFKRVEEFGGEVIMTPSDLPSGSDRVAWVAKGIPAGIVVNLQGDEPLIEAQFIDQLVKSLQNNENYEIATLAVRKNDVTELNSPNCVKVVINEFGEALYFSRHPLVSAGTSEFLKHIGIYAYRRNSLFKFCQIPPSSLERAERLEQLRALQNGMKISLSIVAHDTVAVDVPEDILRVEDCLKK